MAPVNQVPPPTTVEPAAVESEASSPTGADGDAWERADLESEVAEREEAGRWTPVLDRSEVTRLGEGLAETGAIAPAAQERTLAAIRAALAAFQELERDLGGLFFEHLAGALQINSLLCRGAGAGARVAVARRLGLHHLVNRNCAVDFITSRY